MWQEYIFTPSTQPCRATQKARHKTTRNMRVYIYIYTVAVWLQELKIKAGAEKLREVATDRKALSDVATIVKKSNSKLNELQAELQQLESQIILTQGQPQSPQQNHSNGQGKA